MRHLLVLFTALSVATSAFAKKPSKKDEKTMMVAHDAYLEAMRDSNFDAAASHMHPDELQRLHDMVAPLLAHGLEKGGPMPFLEAETAEELEALSPEMLFINILEFGMNREPGLARAMKTARTRTIGVVVDGQTAYLVYELEMVVSDIKVRKNAVTAMIPHEDGWRLALTGDMESMAEGLKLGMERNFGPIE